MTADGGEACAQLCNVDDTIAVLVEGDEAGIVDPGTDSAVLAVVADAVGADRGAVVTILVGEGDAVGPYVSAVFAIPVDGPERARSDYLWSLLRHHGTDQGRCRHHQK